MLLLWSIILKVFSMTLRSPGGDRREKIYISCTRITISWPQDTCPAHTRYIFFLSGPLLGSIRYSWSKEKHRLTAPQQ